MTCQGYPDRDHADGHHIYPSMLALKPQFVTMTGDVGGTIAFIAPEQITQYRDAKPPADQYAAAATLYNLLTGRYIYDLPREISRQLALILNEEPVPILNRRPDLPALLAKIIHKALERDPGDRYPDVRAFLDALKSFSS